MIQVFKPDLGREELDALAEIFETGWIGLGPKTAEFERRFAGYVGARYAVGLNSATAALHLSLLALGVGPGDEVLVPTVTFVSTAHAAVYCGARPVFVDVRPDTLCMSPDDLRRRITDKSRVVVPVHYGGRPCEMDELWGIAEMKGLQVVDDAAHACGSEWRGRKVGGLPRTAACCFSGHAVKNLAMGDGGMLTTDRLEVATAARSLRWCGIDKSTWDREEEHNAGLGKTYSRYSWYYEVRDLGYKCHMNDVAAVIGLVQLRKLDAANDRRREICGMYDAAFALERWIETPPPDADGDVSARHNYVIRTDRRDDLNLWLKDRNIASGVHYMPIHLQPFYRRLGQPRLPVAEKVWKRLLTLPLYPSMTDGDVEAVVGAVLEFGGQKA